ncbi:MAG: prolipoprotein diacylglyceryl transferase [Prevotella sp.]|nr:prolipoprotein diacylglyceryl transferase [Prevotella sp.]
MNYVLFITWNPSEIALRLGPLALRWYSLCWLIGLIGAYFIVRWLYKDQKVKDELFDPLFIYCFLGIIIGARLGHCLFYEPDYFTHHITEMFLPIQETMNPERWTKWLMWLPTGNAETHWGYTGYAGLASHGGTLGLMIALWLYCRNTKMNLWHVLDDIAIATPFTACFIRLGNLMNSEIIGKPTDLPWAFVFEQVDNIPRHPGQLYEAIAYALFLFVMFYFYRKSTPQSPSSPLTPSTSKPTAKPVGSGFYFGLVLTLIFTFRFFIEYTKDIQVDFEATMPFNMGQLLSIPFIAIGILCMRGGKWMKGAK